MNLTDLCNEFWDDIVSLMDFRVIEKIANPKARLSRVDAVRAYCREDQDFWDVLGCYLYLDKGEIAKEKRMQRMAS